MNYRRIYADISIVTVGNVNRDVCNPLNLFKHRVISQEEIGSINEKDMRIDASTVSYRTRSFELFCNTQRMQVRAEDCTRSDQLSDLTLNILRLSEATPTAIGINATYRIGVTVDSYLRLCEKCLPITSFSPLADNALLLDVSFMKGGHLVKDGQPQEVYNFKRLRDSIDNQIIIQISVNNHLDMNDGMNTAIYYLSQASKLHSLFFEKSQQFISGI